MLSKASLLEVWQRAPNFITIQLLTTFQMFPFGIFPYLLTIQEKIKK